MILGAENSATQTLHRSTEMAGPGWVAELERSLIVGLIKTGLGKGAKAGHRPGPKIDANSPSRTTPEAQVENAIEVPPYQKCTIFLCGHCRHPEWSEFIATSV